MGESKAHRTLIVVGLLVLIASEIATAGAAVVGYPPFFSQPSARTLLFEPLAILVAYAVAILVIARMRGDEWGIIGKNAVGFGCIAGAVEVVNIAVENGVPFTVHGPLFPIAGMVSVFGIWGLAGFGTSRDTSSIRSGLFTSVFSAGICMIIGVTAGFAFEFFLTPPRPETITTWAEFQRSGWSDPHAFGLANTLDSASTHLLVAPLGGAVVGGLASWAGRRMGTRR